MPRYKLVCQATVGESNGQSMRVASRCLWDKDFDTCAETTWTNVRAPLAATLLHHTALVWRPCAELRQLSPSRRLPARTEQGVRRCDVLCVVLRVSERAGPLRRRLLQDAAAEAAVRALRSSALRARSAPPAPAGRMLVRGWHRTAQVYPFLPPRRSPGLILSLDYSFQMHEEYTAPKKHARGAVSTLPPPQKTDVSFLCCCLLATWVCAPPPTSPAPPGFTPGQVSQGVRHVCCSQIPSCRSRRHRQAPV